jgi:hypothetical protein
LGKGQPIVLSGVVRSIGEVWLTPAKGGSARVIQSREAAVAPQGQTEIRRL